MRYMVAIFAAAAAWCGPAGAAMVTISGSGTLTGTSTPFTVTATYNDANTFTADGGSGLYFYPPAMSFSWTAGGQTYVPSNLYSMTYNVFQHRLGLGTIGDSFPSGSIILNVNRTGFFNALPTMAELLGQTGTFSFFATGPTPMGGTGTFTNAGAVPEPASWAMMIAGFGVAGAVARRRDRTTPATA